jgi:nucleoside-diphosphate-sugar epimerase
MECLVTGAAGFIGSHLCERLLADGCRVLGIDCFTPYYDCDTKERNLAAFRDHPRFDLVRADLAVDDLGSLLRDVEVVFHLAAMPGLVHSWTDYDLYQRCNILATQRLLQGCRGQMRLARFVYASTSSVYGREAAGDETLPLRPCSPYGVTKLAAENLCRAYADAFDVPAVVLRYFSVYGPRQRPDMAYHKFIRALLDDQPIDLYGDGLQVRGNTYVADCVEATVAATRANPGDVFNVGGGEVVSIAEVIRKMERLTGRTAKIVRHPERKGDQRHTGADVTRIANALGWRPKVTLDEGLSRQIEWHARPRLRQAA